MTPTERAYARYVGKLYWSNPRNALVMITGLTKTNYGNKWKYNISYYGNPQIDVTDRSVPCVRIKRLITNKDWIPADQYITNQPPVSSEK